MSLNQLQRAQARKDLAEIQDANLKIQNNPIVPADMKKAFEAQVRLLDTLAIGAEVFVEGGE